jgi:GNAT superfamily N-acetyltransferase
MTDLVWQPASPADESALLASMAAFYAEEQLAFAPAEAGASLHRLLTTPAFGQVFLLLARDDPARVPHGHLALTLGFSLEFHGRFALLDELYLAPSARGRGFGRAAIDTAAAWARTQEVTTLRLEMNHANRRARDFYLAAGFTADRRDLLTRRV